MYFVHFDKVEGKLLHSIMAAADKQVINVLLVESINGIVPDMKHDLGYCMNDFMELKYTLQDKYIVIGDVLVYDDENNQALRLAYMSNTCFIFTVISPTIDEIYREPTEIELGLEELLYGSMACLNQKKFEISYKAGKMNLYSGTDTVNSIVCSPSEYFEFYDKLKFGIPYTSPNMRYGDGNVSIIKLTKYILSVYRI